jgi:hypothetical protein
MTYIYALEVSFSQVGKNYQLLCQTVGDVCLGYLSKIKDSNMIWQTIEDALITHIFNQPLISMS